MLSKLDDFFSEIEPQVDFISGEENDTQAFMKLMRIFNKVRAIQTNERGTPNFALIIVVIVAWCL